jgi:hypothetical protein
MLLITAIIAVKRPVMHKQVLIEDINFSFVAEAPQVQSSDSSSEKKNSTSNQTSQKVDNIKKPSTTSNTSQSSQSKPQNVKGNIISRINNAAQNAAQKPIQQKPNKVATPARNQAGNSNNQTAQNQQTKQIIQKPEPVIIKKEVVNVPRQLTEEEEIIAWNNWRSNLQNQVMKDAKIGAPLGTVFKFSFTVDKFGTISNLKVWSTDPMFTNLGIRVIRPIIVKYQGQPVLGFPEGTKRIITNVTGGFVMSTQTGYSKPSDYSDYETVKK